LYNISQKCIFSGTVSIMPIMGLFHTVLGTLEIWACHLEGDFTVLPSLKTAIYNNVRLMLHNTHPHATKKEVIFLELENTLFKSSFVCLACCVHRLSPIVMKNFLLFS